MYICTHKPSINYNMFRLESTWLWQYGHDTIPDWDGKLLIVNTDAHNSLVETNALPGTIAAYGYTIVLQGSYLLQQTSLPIADIAVRLHFSETASLTRFFTRMKGVNPSMYRKGR